MYLLPIFFIVYVENYIDFKLNVKFVLFQMRDVKVVAACTSANVRLFYCVKIAYTLYIGYIYS